MIAAVEFYDGDWCGIIEGDLVMDAWCPVLWYNRIKKGMTATRFKDLEDTKALERWVEALYQCKPITIPDTIVYEESHPEEYDIYQSLNAKSVLAVPFWKNPIGFLIVRNPKRYINQSSFLQMLAFVVFSSVTEKKLIDRANKAFSPENIKVDTDIIINLFGSLEIYTSKGDKFIARIIPQGNNRFTWFINVSGKSTEEIDMIIEGRKIMLQFVLMKKRTLKTMRTMSPQYIMR